ncbi:Spectrin-binding region of Ca2+-Calmodulin [Popillia japonica]|uniref:Spectrin-binding region of Ca2+-Calmodulin n=1 Tax=Popillia japonica TaxID=7064 RepID=A0AAW1K319_POPJA
MDRFDRMGIDKYERRDRVNEENEFSIIASVFEDLQTSTADDKYERRDRAKQRAAIKWLLSKAFNNKVPKNLSEPFYRDHEQEHLKPPIIGSLANAELYCMALSNIYSDPNYHNLSHWSILQTLARKGVCVTEPSNSALTETTLIQTNPLRLNAHMAVIESIMTLYAREVVTPDRVMAITQRFSHTDKSIAPSMPESHEQGLLMWISHTCEALQKKIEQKLESGVSNGGEGDRLRAPSFPPIRELKDLCDGVAIAALIAYHCPDELHWTDIKVPRLPTVSESLHNLGLVQDFCNRCLPSSIFHMMPADITYMRGSMKQNLIVFLADLFNVLEIHPVKYVRYPGMDRTATVTRSTPTHTPLRKTNSFQQSVVSDMSEDSLRRGSDDSFVVHRGKNIPTLSSIINDEQQRVRNLSKERQNNDTKADERGESKAAGKPSNWEEHKKPSYAGRRSRRNSMTEDSQLTIENFGGSQDNLNFIGRNPDKDVAVHIGRKISAPSAPIENPAVRSTIQDARGSFQLGYDNGCEKSDIERENFKLKKQLSSDDISLRNLKSDFFENKTNRMSFADMANHVGAEPKGIQLTYTPQQQQQSQEDKEELPAKSSFKSSNPHTNGEKKTTSFATLPNTTTWQQQSSHTQQNLENNANSDDSPGGGQLMASQLNDIRMKLEEKRRNIETEKRKVEVAMNKQRQKVGNAAFLQAVVKGKGNVLKSPNDAMTDSLVTGDSEPSSPAPDSATSKPQRPFTLQEISDDASSVERKWLDQDQPYLETRRTPDIENMDMEQYHHSMANLQDIQADIQRLANQQKQIQAAQEQQMVQHQKQLFQQSTFMTMAQHPASYATQQSYNPPQYQQGPMFTPLQSSASAPHIPQSLYQTHPAMNQPQFFLHQQQQPMHMQSTQSIPMQPQQPIVPQRRTWAQQAQTPPLTSDSYQPDLRTWGKPQSAGGGFVLHESTDRFQVSSFQESPARYQNGGEHTLNHSSSHPGFTLSQQHQQQQLYSGSHSTPSASPQHRNVHRQISQLMDDSKRTVSLQQIEQTVRKSSVTHAPIPAPPVDDMAPQSISFIGNPNDDISESLSRLNITSGSRTYRIPSPTRPLLSRNAFQPSPPLEKEQPVAEVSSLDNDPTSQKGFYISFDNEQPKRPKPQLRTKKMSPKKERSLVEDEPNYEQIQEALEKERRAKQLERELEHERMKEELEERRKIEYERQRRETSQEREKAGAAIIIGNELSNPDPELLDEKERKKERIMMLSMQRRQQQEEAKQRKEQEAHARREREKAKEEEKAKKKEEQAHRRAAIFEQYKLKKAIEEAEREGKDVDKSLLNSLKPAPKMRPKVTSRPRPKTIHIDSGSVEMAEGLLQPSRGKKGSNTNLTVAPSYSTSTMKRDYYRGSQDSLAGSGLLYSKDSPDDSRGMSPCHSANQTLGRRSSYKTSRDPSPAQTRGRPKYSTYQNFKGRKSNSMMNLYGSSTDQDSLAYRYGDTDSGLGRATPPRRAPSPGMGPMRHLPSPSGPGSLPGLMTKRRIFDDGSSDISSTPSSMMDYTGPRLYKQPTTKSNRGIMLNAVEYCVFPGVVNKDAKQKVLEEIARSESKHFLILFRDTGCQFRALYSYCPDREEVIKLYGTGPKQVNDRMFDKFFKYNSGGKCFSQVHTKHLTVTIDAFTIHNSLWQGKKVNLPNKKDMTLVI